MNEKKYMKIKSLAHALEIFEKKAVQHGLSSKLGESSRKINHQYDGIVNTVKWLYANNELIQLKKFYTSNNTSVRSWAASFLLEIDTTDAEKILEDLIILNYSDAKLVLMEWKAGTLDMNFFKQ